MDENGRKLLSMLRNCGYRDKILLLPMMAATAFIFFAAKYMPDMSKGFTAMTPLTRTYNVFVLQTFPMDVIQLVTSCHKITPLVVTDPASIRCLYGDSCDQNTSFPIYRFAMEVNKENLTSARNDFRKIVSFAFGWGWISSWSASIDSISLRKNNITATISTMEIRPKYWYLHSSRLTPVHEPPRAFRGLNMSQIKVDYQNETILLVPSPVDFYLWQHPRSRFMDCNRTSAKYLRRKNPDIYREPPVVHDSYVEILAHARDIFSDHRITIMLAGGTGLGWYRECGIIPHTTDTDMAFLISEWKTEMENVLLNDSMLTLHWILGKAEDGMEITVRARGNKIDIFGLYELKNSSFVGAMDVGAREKLRWWYPKFNGACTCDLKGELFYVRCDILAALKQEYGPEWYEHHHSRNYVWQSSHHNVEKAGTINESDWSSVFRQFD